MVMEKFKTLKDFAKIVFHTPSIFNPLFLLPPQANFDTISIKNQQCDVCDDLNKQNDSQIGQSPKVIPSVTFETLQRGISNGCPNCALIWASIIQYCRTFLKSRISKLRQSTWQSNAPALDEWGLSWKLERGHSWEKKDLFVKYPHLEIFTSEPFDGHPWPNLPLGAVVTCPQSNEFYETIKAWIQDCSQEHLSCTTSKACLLPSRLLDLERWKGMHDIVLCVELPQNAKYVALSYCWGQSQPLTTKLSTLEERQHCISWNTLPRLFQDLVTVVTRLGIRYLWIDSLCIIQDDKADWARESSKMGDIYENAWCTIAATAAHGTTETLFPSIGDTVQLDFKPSDYRGPPIWLRTNVDHGYMWGNEEAAPLNQRAWTFQEHLLSRRLLQFCTKEVVWDCSGGLQCQCLKGTRYYKSPSKEMFSRAFAQASLSMANLGTFWHTSILENYLRRNISYDEDRLPALSGIAKKFSATGQLGIYLAGLWSADLPTALLWRVNPRKIRRGASLPNTPSWSWASLKGSWRYSPPPSEGIRATALVTGFVCIPDSEDPTGTVKKGEITVSSLFQPAVLKYLGPNYIPRAILACSKQSASADVDACFPNGLPDTSAQSLSGETVRYLASFDDMSAVMATEDVYCLEIAQGITKDKVSYMAPSCADEMAASGAVGSWNLILRQSKQFRGKYERIGVSFSGSGWFSGASKETITIV